MCFPEGAVRTRKCLGIKQCTIPLIGGWIDLKCTKKNNTFGINLILVSSKYSEHK